MKSIIFCHGFCVGLTTLVDLSFLEDSVCYAMKYCWFPPKYSLIITLQSISTSGGTIQIFIQTSVMSSDRSVTLKKRLRVKIRFARLKAAQVLLMIIKTKQGDLQKRYIILHSFQTSRILSWLELIGNSVCNAFHQQVPWNLQPQSTSFIQFGGAQRTNTVYVQATPRAICSVVWPQCPHTSLGLVLFSSTL